MVKQGSHGIIIHALGKPDTYAAVHDPHNFAFKAEMLVLNLTRHAEMDTDCCTRLNARQGTPATTGLLLNKQHTAAAKVLNGAQPGPACCGMYERTQQNCVSRITAFVHQLSGIFRLTVNSLEYYQSLRIAVGKLSLNSWFAAASRRLMVQPA
jgi:hypothetical protein